MARYGHPTHHQPLSAPLGLPGFMPDWNTSQHHGPPRDAYQYLNEYVDMVDALPTELTRSFGDLRELDAVLTRGSGGEEEVLRID